MAKKSSKKSSVTKADLEKEVEFYKGTTSELNEYANSLEVELEKSETYAQELVDDLDEQSDVIGSLQVALVDSHQTRDALAAEIESNIAVFSLIDDGLKLVLETSVQRNEKIKELEADNFHLTIQRDALKERVQYLEQNPVVVYSQYVGSGQYSFEQRSSASQQG